MKFSSILLSTLMLFGASAIAAETTTQKSARIAQAVKAMSPAALSGVDTFKTKSNQTVKAALLELAVKFGYIESAEEFNWERSEHYDNPWDGESNLYGAATMKEAYEYITRVDQDHLQYFIETDDKKAIAAYMAKIEKAKEGFQLLLNTGVKFGVVPFGAVQCGFTLSALAIIDPHTGKIYIFQKEGSGC
jgi:hypothetical protein